MNTKADTPEALTQSEMRTLRKMHMVRPDLIPFPLKIDVYC